MNWKDTWVKVKRQRKTKKKTSEYAVAYIAVQYSTGNSGERAEKRQPKHQTLIILNAVTRSVQHIDHL